MDLIKQNELTDLLKKEENGVCVSLFMPLESEPDKQQVNSIRLKNLLKQGKQQLTTEAFLPSDFPSLDIEALFQPAESLLTGGRMADGASKGLAIFLAEGMHRIYRLPLPLDETAVIGPRFHVKPLLPFLNNNRNGRFYLLSLSQNQVQLWHGTQVNLEPVEVPNLPDGIDEALMLEDPETSLQFHTSTGQADERPAAYHGHDAEKEKKGAILRYFREVNKAIQAQLADEEAPLLLAAVEYLWPIYKEANTYLYLLADGISGNPEHLNAKELQQRAWPIMRRHLEKTQESAIEQYQEVANTENTSHTITEIVPAAAYGRIDTLFITPGEQQPGRFDPDSGEVEVCQSQTFVCEDLLNLVAANTLLHGGKIYAVQPEEMPASGQLAAIFRYPG